ncbi:medium-chain acyl-CoA ligase ACSF2, mitochondrial [Ixodes scapularis]
MPGVSQPVFYCALRKLKCTPQVIRSSNRTLASLSYFHNPGREPLLPWTLGQVVDRTADVKGDNAAVVSRHQNITKTYTQLRDDVNQFAAALVSLKLAVGSKIGMLAPNLYEWVVVQFAAANAGLVLVNVNTAYQVPELEFCLNHAECAALIVAGKCSRQDYYKMLLQMAPELERGALPGELKSTRLPFLKHVILIDDAPMRGTVTFDDLMKSATGADHAAMRSISSKLQFDATVNVQFTSGTTGGPKAAQLSHFNVVNNANLNGRLFGLHENSESICLNVPMLHCYGCVCGSLAAAIFGSTIVMPAPSFKAKAALEAIAEQRCTFIYGTPTMYVDIINEQREGMYDVSSVRKAVMAGAPCPQELVKHAKKTLNVQKFYMMYGSTEASPIITGTNPSEPMEQWIETVGTPLDHTEVKIVDSQDRIVPVNQSGELCARGYLVFKGYLKQDEKTREVVRDNWYHTGDEATMSEEGRITIRGRLKDLIIRGGDNIYPQEIEHFLYTHSDVLEVQVVGVPDPRFGEEVCAWIKLKSGKKLSHDDVISFCKGKISHYKIPRYVLLVDSFPKTESGKIQKHKMRVESVKILNL